jgi:hypothetical protein
VNGEPLCEDDRVKELAGKVEELTWPSPFGLSGFRIGISLRHALVRNAPMMPRILLADPSPERDDHYGEPTLSEGLARRPKAAFQWPPDCMWPFKDHGSDSDT